MSKKKAPDKITKSEDEWRAQLSPEAYKVVREHQTEAAFSHPYHGEKRIGDFSCICCGEPLFSSQTKFESGTGWPSFYAPKDDRALSEHKDYSFFQLRTEVRCAKCDSHLGHVFPDGPKPTGLRYCMNGIALKFSLASSAEKGALQPPCAEKKPHKDCFHGIERCDDYAWLRADNWQEVMRKPELLEAPIRAYLEAENTYLEHILSPTENLQVELYEEMKGRIKENDSTVPAPDGPWEYYVSYQTGGQHPRFCRRPRGAENEQLLVDGNQLAQGLAYFRLTGVTHSPDHSLVAYGFDDKGSEYYTLKVRDLESNQDLEDVIAETSGGLIWAADSRTVFYTRLDDHHRSRWVYRHKIGTPADQDVLVYEELDPGFFVSLGATQSRDYILIELHDHQTSEIYFIPANGPSAPPKLVSPRTTGHEYSLDHHGDKFILLTNADGAEDFKIAETEISRPGRENWRDIEPHRPGRLILDVTAFSDHLVRLEREGGLPKIVIRRFSDGKEYDISFEEEAYSLGLSVGYEFATSNLRFSYSSMTTPQQVFDYDMESQQRVLRKTQEIPSGHAPENYLTERLMAPAEDGEEVPVTLLMHKDTRRDGTAPLLLYGYGAYGISIPAAFSTNVLSLVDRGFVYAIAHIRGGKDKGYGWYTSGRRENKTNSFKDFIAVANHLAHKNYTSRGQIVAHGGSAGGMLMGAVANIAPDLFQGIIAEVPFVDVLTTMLDDTLPLTPPEWPEWGNPIESKEAYQAIACYSPYDNVCAQNYPHILAVGGLTDPRVTYWEPAKWVAKLRALKHDDNLVLLKTNMDAGHGGASGRFDRLKDVALCYAFALKVSQEGTAHAPHS